MAKTWTIETAKPADSEEIQKLLRTVWLETYPNEEFNITTEDIESKQFLSEEIVEKRREILSQKNLKRLDLVARKDGNIIGWCAAEKKKHFGQILTIYIHPDFQRNGIGRAFIKKVLNWLNDYLIIVVEAAVYNQKAIDFYKRFGFKETMIKSEYKFPSGKEIPTMVLAAKKDRKP